MRETDLAYYAGLIDGEGSIYITRIRRKDTKHHGIRYTLFLTVTNQNEQVIKDLKRDFQFGTVISKKTVKGKDIYVWIIHSQRVVKVLSQVYPYIRIKKKEVELAQEFQALLSHKVRKKSFLEMAKREEIRQTLAKGRTKGHPIMKIPKDDSEAPKE